MSIRRICLYPNRNRPISEEGYRNISGKLLSLGYVLSVTNPQFSSESIPYLSAEEAFERCDLAIALGGDGTILSAAKYALQTNTPLLGINFGTLGYMSELEASEYELLDTIPTGHLESRMLLDVTVLRDGKPIRETYTALNEACILRTTPGSMPRFTLYCDGHTVSSYKADGLILSTPTGSSAYNLSVGGPIIDPKMNAFCVSPIAPHTLSSVRSLVFSQDSVLEVRIDNEAAVTADSDQISLISNQEIVRVKKSRSSLKFLRLKNAGFYEILNNKLT